MFLTAKTLTNYSFIYLFKSTEKKTNKPKKRKIYDQLSQEETQSSAKPGLLKNTSVCPLAGSPSGHSAQPPVIPPGLISGMSQSIQGKAPANGVPMEEMGVTSAISNYKKIAFPDFYIF